MSSLCRVDRVLFMDFSESSKKMITKLQLIIFILVVILLASVYTVYTVSCEQEKASKLGMLKATRQQLGNAEQAVMECKSAVQKIEAEIASLRDGVIEKKITELRTCKAKFDSKIDVYKALYSVVNGREASESHINAMKRRLGIGGGL
jgi:peptidoglycan hydrolase CwlO-like protein